MFVTMSATNATKSATKPANDSATKDVGKANNITVKTKAKLAVMAVKQKILPPKPRKDLAAMAVKLAVMAV